MGRSSAGLNDVQEAGLSVERRSLARERLIACAEEAVAASGLEGLRARDLAACAGCSVGAIYNLVADLDELALLVAQRTLIALDDWLLDHVPAGACETRDFEALAIAYARFATAHRNRWRALFEHRLPDRDLPVWFAADQVRLFERLEARLRRRFPHLDAATASLRARTLFSAVHGIVSLGTEEKLVAMPVGAIEDELALFIRAYLGGLETAG